MTKRIHSQKTIRNLWFNTSYCIFSMWTRLVFNSTLLIVISICSHFIDWISDNNYSIEFVSWYGSTVSNVNNVDMMSKTFWYISEWFAISIYIAFNLGLRNIIMFCTHITSKYMKISNSLIDYRVTTLDLHHFHFHSNTITKLIHFHLHLK